MKFAQPGEQALVSVCLLAYNHEKWIHQAIDSVLMQKTDFSCEFIIAEDCSPDTTPNIVKEYADRYPIKLILQPKNKGAALNWKDLMEAPTGKYVAFLEGDDSWADPLKLKKQVEILEKDNHISACYSNATIFDTKNSASNIWFKEGQKPSIVLDAGSIVAGAFTMPTCTFFFRNLLKPIPDWTLRARSGDLLMAAMISKFGKVYYIDECLGHNNHDYTGLSKVLKEVDFQVDDFFTWLDMHKFFEYDPKIWNSIVVKCYTNIDKLFYRGYPMAARRLFWKWPLLKVIRVKGWRFKLFKMAVKLHFPYFLYLRRVPQIFKK